MTGKKKRKFTITYTNQNTTVVKAQMIKVSKQMAQFMSNAGSSRTVFLRDVKRITEHVDY